jgi:hypothetical protein
MIDSLATVVGMGGDTATVAIAFAIWKLDRRVVRLEAKIK